MIPSRASLFVAVLCAACGGRHGTRTLDLPPRPSGAPGGAQIAREVRALELEAREARLYAEIARGNVPGWLRELARVEMMRDVDGTERVVEFWVTPDYLAVGSDEDYFLTPLSPQTAQRIADLVDGSLLTPPMVDAVWAEAGARLGPDSISPGPEMTTVPVFEDHDRMVRARRARDAAPMGSIVAGHKKDVVLTPRLDSLPGRVAIYGWHRPDGRPIQPLYTGHTDRWVDYSHGIRLVARSILIDGRARLMSEILRDPALARLLSEEGPIREPRYSLTPGGADGNDPRAPVSCRRPCEWSASGRRSRDPRR